MSVPITPAFEVPAGTMAVEEGAGIGRFPRSLRFYVAASTIYAALVFLAVHVVYGLELGRAGVRLPHPEAVISSIDTVSFITWLGISVIAGTVLYRLATALEGVQDESQVREIEIGSIFAMGQALSGSLDVPQISREFVAAARRRLDPSVTAALLVYDDAIEAFRVVAEEGPRSGSLIAHAYTASALPSAIRTRVIDHQQSLVLPDTSSRGEQWERLAGVLPDAKWIRSFAALPLVSHDRLVGVVIAAGEKPGAVTADNMQLTLMLGQFVAGSISVSLSLLEAEARADREAIISRITERARATLDPDEVLRSTVEELGRSLHVSRVVAATGATPEALHVSYEWTAPGVAAQASSPSALGVARLVAQVGRTAVFTDVTADARLSDVRRPEATRAVLGTPILVGGQLVGTLTLSEAERTRDWSADEVRLVEGVARELRVAMETARLFQSRQRENERLLALQTASSALAAQTSARNVIDEILKIAARLLGRGSASLYTWEEAQQMLILVQNFDPRGHEVARTLRSGEGIAGHAFGGLAPFIINDYQSWEGASETAKKSGLQAGVSVPLVLGGRPLGALVVRSYEVGARFTLDESRLLTLFGDQAAATLATAEAFAKQRQAVEQLERLNRAKSEFVSIVSHEFRTPLTGIMGFSEMMRDEDLTPLEMKEFAGDINRDAQRLTRMINEMLDLSRMESGRMTLRREPMDLNSVIAEVADRIRPNAPDHTIDLVLQPELPTLDGDRDRLTQVASNLLNNAVKYSPTGGVITVTTRSDGGSIHLLVRDQGMGIPPEALETIFEQYSRIESEAMRNIQGTGLGLPIVRQIVELHGGKVWAESELGKGSVFNVALPLAATAKPVEA